MNDTIKILFAGDFASNGRCEEVLLNKEYSAIFKKIKPVIENADYSVVNMESPIAKATFKAIKKVGPSIKAPEEIADAVKFCGFDMVALANNHMNDYGAEGVLYTIQKCQESGLDIIGAGNNIKVASKTVYKKIRQRTFAFINCCEHEFSIADDNTPGCNPLSPIDQYHEINAAKTRADYVVVMVHGGIEMYQLPTQRMQKTYRFFVEAGADVVVNHHQHCFSGYEKYGNGLIIYGLGNFCFDWPSRKEHIWNEGYIAEVLFSGKSISLHLHPYFQGTNIVGIEPMNEAFSAKFYKEIEQINSIIADPQKLQDSYNGFLNKTRNDFKAILSPYSSRISTALCRRGYLPVRYGAYQLRRILLNISCESHIERLKHYIKTQLK